MVSRRKFMAATAGVAATMLSQRSWAQEPDASNEFRLAFAPHPGTFRASAGQDVLDQIRYAHEQGFRAWEHNPMPNESSDRQTAIGDLLHDLKMRMGVFVGYADFQRPVFSVKKPEYREEVLTGVKSAIEVAGRCGATHFTVVPGTVDQQTGNKWGGARLAEGYQFANVVDLLRECAKLLEPHNLVMVLEPLNWYANHGGVFLQRSDQAYAICRAVESPSCKILFDIYHQQITEGNLIPNIERCWDEIGYFQIGDNPGRQEPGTGEINYAKICRYIHDRCQQDGKSFIFGMEHGSSQKGKPGEQAIIQAYRSIDPR